MRAEEEFWERELPDRSYVVRFDTHSQGMWRSLAYLDNLPGRLAQGRHDRTGRSFVVNCVLQVSLAP